MTKKRISREIALIGGGPSALFLYQKLIRSDLTNLSVTIFESKAQLGAGMPYSAEGAGDEHVTNVSDTEIPPLVMSIEEWVKIAPKEILDHFQLTTENFNEYKVLPRLFFGAYLSAQFELLVEEAGKRGIVTHLHLGCRVMDIIDHPDSDKVTVETHNRGHLTFDQVVICTGHYWPVTNEGKIPGYFDSPYPPAKLALKLNHPVALKGSSLTAIDAIRTLARANGTYSRDKHNRLVYRLADESKDFKVVMHSRSGLLPAVRFHLYDSHLSGAGMLTEMQLQEHRKANNGFISLDYLFEQDFKQVVKKRDPKFYQEIKDLQLEQFVSAMMDFRRQAEPFALLKAEYEEAERSFKSEKSIYWKESLAMLSFAMNYPAKYLCAEDMLRFQETLMPLIGIVISFVPQSSCEELFALHEAGVLDIVAVGGDRDIDPLPDGGIVYTFTDENEKERSSRYPVFVNCVGQPHLPFEKFPFRSLLEKKRVGQARLKFKDKGTAREAKANGNRDVQSENGQYFLKVPGIAINDNFQVIDAEGLPNKNIYMMAVPFIGGFNPDYSGLDFCSAASGKIVSSMRST